MKWLFLDGEGLLPVHGGGELVAFSWKIILQEFNDVAFVIDDENGLGHCYHSGECVAAFNSITAQKLRCGHLAFSFLL